MVKKKISFGDIEYLILDWDGTLADSMDAYTQSFAKTLDKHFGLKKESTKSFYLNTAGAPLSDQFRRAIKKFTGVEIKQTEKLEDEFWHSLEGLKPKPITGAKDFLRATKAREIKIIIWSGTRTNILKEKISLLSFSSYVDFVIGNTPGSLIEVKGPGLFKIIAKKMGVKESIMKQKTLVIGDGQTDMEAGIAIGAWTAGFTTGKTKRELLSFGADIVFDDFSEILNHF